MLRYYNSQILRPFFLHGSQMEMHQNIRLHLQIINITKISHKFKLSFLLVLLSYKHAWCLFFRKKTAMVHSPMTSVYGDIDERIIIVLTFNTGSCVCQHWCTFSHRLLHQWTHGLSLHYHKFLWPYMHKLMCMPCCWFYRRRRLGDMLTSCSDRQSAPEEPLVLDLWSGAQDAGRHSELSCQVQLLVADSI